jgi:hypothetical protein
MDKNIAAILRNDTRTVSVIFQDDTRDHPVPYTYVTDLALQCEDYAIVEVTSGLKVVQVKVVHDDLRIEPNSDIEYKWIVAHINLTPYQENMARNRTITETLGKAYQKQARQAFATALLDSVPESERGSIAALIGRA